MDESFRPLNWTKNDYEKLNSKLVFDKATGLLWESLGSASPMTWSQAVMRTQSLNQKRIGGVSTWHLPTIDELMTILDPVPHKTGHCIVSLFDVKKSWLWSSDCVNKKKAWCANVQNGFIGYKDKNCYLFARHVARLNI